jgi:hypothetical protein
MIIALHCRRCGADGQAEGLDVFAAVHAAEVAGWVTNAIVQIDGIYDVVDVCQDCLADPRPELPGQSVIANLRATLGLRP